MERVRAWPRKLLQSSNRAFSVNISREVIRTISSAKTALECSRPPASTNEVEFPETKASSLLAPRVLRVSAPAMNV